MGIIPKEDTERNKSLYEDWLSRKFSNVDLVKKYSITPQRIYQIVKKYEAKLGIDKVL